MPPTNIDVPNNTRITSSSSTYPVKYSIVNKGNNKITELRAILQRESQNS